VSQPPVLVSQLVSKQPPVLVSQLVSGFVS
jgi:hypothetical protein